MVKATIGVSRISMTVYTCGECGAVYMTRGGIQDHVERDSVAGFGGGHGATMKMENENA